MPNETTEREGLSIIQSGNVLVLVLSCRSDAAASSIRDMINGDIADFGKFTLALGRTALRERTHG